MKHTDLSPIPAVETATDPIHSATDLRQRWRALMGPLGFGERLLRFVIVGTDRRFITILIDVMIPDVPDRERVATAMAALAELLAEHEPGATVAVLLTGPGRGRVSETDRAWA
ncbi:MAG: hypothetical protein ACXWZL_12550, partial [Mycobacterium sp.]